MTTRGRSDADEASPEPGDSGEAAKYPPREVLSTRANEQKESPGQNEKLMEQVADPANLNIAWKRVRENGGAPGIDGITIAAFLEHAKPRAETLRRELLEGIYRPSPLRRVKIPKPTGGERLLGIPTVQDRVVQQAFLQILQPILDPAFSEHSYGFRPNRSAHQAVAAAQAYLQQGHDWVVDFDLEAFLVPCSYYTLGCGLIIEEARKGIRHFDPQALTTAAMYEDRWQVAALYPLHHGLARNAENASGIDHWHEALRGPVDESCAQGFVDADLPWGAGSDLLTCDESLVKPAMQSRGRGAERFGCARNGHALPVLSLLHRLETGDVPVGAQTADAVDGERKAAGGLSFLAIEDAGDDRVGIMRRQAAQEADRVVVGAHGGLAFAGQRHFYLAEKAATPTKRQMGAELGAVDRDDDLFEQRVQQFLAIPIGGGGQGPDDVEILPECRDGLSLFRRQRPGPCVLTPTQLVFCNLQFPQGLFPLRFQPAGDEAIIGIDCAVAAFGALRTVTGPLDVVVELGQCSFVVDFDLL